MSHLSTPLLQIFVAWQGQPPPRLPEDAGAASAALARRAGGGGADPGPLGLYQNIIDGFKERLAQEFPDVDVEPRHADNDKAKFDTLVRTAINDRPNIIAPIGRSRRGPMSSRRGKA